MGCYVMEPEVFRYIPENVPYGMDSVVKNAISDGKPVGSFLIKDGFIDIGDKTSYQKANQKFLTGWERSDGRRSRAQDQKAAEEDIFNGFSAVVGLAEGTSAWPSQRPGTCFTGYAQTRISGAGGRA